MKDDASKDTKFDDFAKRYRPTLRPTDTAAYRDAIDASKKQMQHLKTDVFVVRPRRAVASFRGKMIKLQQLRLICSHGIGHTLSLVRLQRESVTGKLIDKGTNIDTFCRCLCCVLSYSFFFFFLRPFSIRSSRVLLPVFYLSTVHLQPVSHASSVCPPRVFIASFVARKCVTDRRRHSLSEAIRSLFSRVCATL